MIHDKPDNAAQVTAVAALLTGAYQLNWGDTYPVNIHHIIPTGVTVSNIGNLNGTSTSYSGIVSTTTHFNRAYMRGGDNSGSIIVIVRDATLLSVYEIITSIALMTGAKRMVTTAAAYYMKCCGIKDVGILTDSGTFSTDMINYQTAITNAGYTYS